MARNLELGTKSKTVELRLGTRAHHLDKYFLLILSLAAQSLAWGEMTLTDNDMTVNPEDGPLRPELWGLFFIAIIIFSDSSTLRAVACAG